MALDGRRKFVLGLSLLAGAGDAATGALLLAAPLRALELMQVPIYLLPLEPIYIRFIGAFVLAVGLSYFYPFLANGSERDERLRHVWVFTALVRSSVAVFVLAAFASGQLSLPWLLVCVNDAGLAVLQTGLLWTGYPGRRG